MTAICFRVPQAKTFPAFRDIGNEFMKLLPRETSEPRGAFSSVFSAALVCTITIRWVQLQRFAVWDDALITYRCARNLASGFGFVYNPGEMVLGVTTPLFGLFLGLVAWLGGDVYTFAPILNIGVDCILLALVMRWAWTDASPLVATLFGFAFALEPQLSASTVGGMEVNVFTLASLASMYLWTRQRAATSAALASLACFLRPEGALLALLLLAAALVGKPTFPRILRQRRFEQDPSDVTLHAEDAGRFSSFDFKRCLKVATTMVVVALPLLTWMWRVYGTVIPQSVRGKALQNGEGFVGTLTSIFVPNPTFPAIALLALWGGYLVFVKRSGLALPILWAAVYVLAYEIGQPPMYEWYSFPIQVVSVLSACVAFESIVDHLLPTTLRNRLTLPNLAALGSMVVLVGGLGLMARRDHSLVRDRVHQGMARWFAAHPIQGQSILAREIGAVGWFSNAHILDGAALVTPEAAEVLDFLEQVAHWQPAFVQIRAHQQPMREWLSSEVSRNYIPIARFSVLGKTNLHPVPSTLPDHWIWDLILLERRDLVHEDRSADEALDLPEIARTPKIE